MTPAERAELEALRRKLGGARALPDDRAPIVLDPVQEDPTVGPGRALALGGSQGATLGFADELGAAAGSSSLGEGVRLNPQALAPSPGDTPEVAAAKGEAIAQMLQRPTPYQVLRDSMREELGQARTERPREVLAGEVGAGLAMTPLLPGAGARAAGPLLAAGGGYGALAGLGASEADISRGTPGAAWDAAGDVATGAGGGLAATLLGKAAPAAGEALERFGVNTGRRALLGGADSLSSRVPTSEAAVREALKTGAILPFGTPGGAHKRLGRSAAALGATYGEILEQLEQKGVRGPQVKPLVEALMRRANEEAAQTATPGVARAYTGAARTLERAADPGALPMPALGPPSPTLGLTQTENLKRSLQEKVPYGRLGAKQIDKARGEVASMLRQANEDAIASAGRAAPPNSDTALLAESFVPVKQRLGRTIEARDAAERGAQRAAQRGSLGLQGQMPVFAAAATGNVPATLGAIASGGLVRGVMNRGASTTAAASFWAGHLAKALKELAGRKGVDAGAAAAKALAAGERELELARALRGGGP